MEEYYRVTGKELPKLQDPPELPDFYVLSEEQKDSKIAFVIGTIVLVAFIAYKW